jgi:D-alanyl-D-alanine carboxypeptidase
MKKHFHYLLFMLLGGTLLAQTPDRAKIDQYFSTLEANNKFMGTVAFSENGKTMYTKSAGYLDTDSKQKINDNSKFRIGSISKMFTSVLIFKAIEDKKLTLADKLDKWFPTVPNASKITIAHLLSHRSGIHNFTNDEVYETYMTQPKTEAEMLAIIATPPSDFEPDSKADYSNSNFVLLTYIVEKTFKKPYAELVKEKITKPLGLQNTYYGGKISTANNEAFSYRYMSKWEKQPETDMSIPAGAGAIVSTSVTFRGSSRRCSPANWFRPQASKA